MELKEFNKKLDEALLKLEMNLDNDKKEKLFNYMKLVIECNEKINLTAITDENEFIIKHIVDSLTVIPYIEDGMKVIDVGTGAGFPGIPLKIVNPTLKITLLDSLNKRIVFLENVIKELNLNEINTIHSRAEDCGKNKDTREKFDIAIARAVAPLNVLLEYLIPLIKVKGKCICMKSIRGQEEINVAKKALQVLNGTIEKNIEITLPNTDMNRNIIIVNKQKETSKIYPRKAGTPSKTPII
ncbi:MAG: 16S rRNA (guanine(527)-N(7))-methyltransferase RsmG [Clostridiales bacterium]|nr:16S rRNA (guanine(527)-N(7))-methyltransferase RsmG [Clostridiales bacterium]